MKKEEFSRLPLEKQFVLINEYAKEVFKEGEESANAFEYGRPCETEPTTFESYINGVPYLRDKKENWLEDIDRIETRNYLKVYNVALDIEHCWKHVKELEEDEAIQYIRKSLKELADDYHAIISGFEFIYKDGTKRFFEL